MKTFPIIEKLGGRAAVAEQLSSDDRLVSRDAIRMWSARGRIPGHAVKRMLAFSRAGSPRSSVR